MSINYQQPSSINTIKYLINNWKAIIFVPLGIAIIIAIYTLFIPNKYKSTANLLPSQRPSFGLDLFSEKGGISSLANSVLGGNSDETNRYVVLLTSYTTSKNIIDEFGLIDIYDVSAAKDPTKAAIDILQDRSSFEGLEEGNFKISVLDEDPLRAKNIADYYIKLLNNLNAEIVSKDARLYREFLEKRYNKIISDLDSLQSEFTKFQEQHGVFELPEQVREYFNLVGLLTAQQLEAEIKLNVLSNSVNKSSEIYKSQLNEYQVISDKLNELYIDDNPKNLVLNFNNIAEIGSEYYDLFFQIELQFEIKKFLLPLYEQAKMEEVKSLPIVSVIDAPRIAILKSEPKRSLITISAGISSMILTILYLIARFSLISNRQYLSSLKN